MPFNDYLCFNAIDPICSKQREILQKEHHAFLILCSRNKIFDKVFAYPVSDPSLYAKKVPQGISILDER